MENLKFEGQDKPKFQKITLENWKDVLRDCLIQSDLELLNEMGMTVDDYMELLEKKASGDSKYQEQEDVDFVDALAKVFDNTEPNVLRRIPSWAFNEFMMIGYPGGSFIDLVPQSPEEEQEIHDAKSNHIKSAKDFISEKGLDHGDLPPIPFIIANNLLDEFNDWKNQKKKKISLGLPTDRGSDLDNIFGNN